MKYKKLFFLYVIFAALLSNHTCIQSSETTPLQKPRYYDKKGHKTPLSPALLAAFDGTMASWDKAKIKEVADERHPDSGDTIAHIACNTETLSKIIKANPQLLFVQNRYGYNPIHQFVRRDRTHHLLTAALEWLEKTPGYIHRAINEQRTIYGDTAAHVAVGSGKYTCLTILCNFGADLCLVNLAQETPGQTAKRLLRKNRQDPQEFERALNNRVSRPRNTPEQFQQTRTPTPTTQQTSELYFDTEKLKPILSCPVGFPWSDCTYPFCVILDQSQ